MATPNRIILKGSPIFKEAKAITGTIVPGWLLMRAATGFQAHGTAAGTGVARIFAVEDEISGRDIDDAYTINDTCRAAYCPPGTEVYAWLEAGAGGDVAIGARLESNGAGALQALTTGECIAVALETVDNDPGTGGANVRIKVEVV